MIKAILAACALLLSGPAWAGWKTEFAAEDRLRAEMREDFDLDRSAEDDGWLFYNRLRFSAKASLGNYDFFAEGMDLRVANKYIPKTAQDDSLDLHQGYAQASKLFGLPLAVKAGRQELKYGRGRLLWASNWGNRVNSIDAVVLKYKEGPLAADAFYGARAGWDPDGWNGPNRHDVLGGVYLTFQKSKDAPLADAYFLANYDGEDRSALNRRTAGLRAAARLPYGIEAEAELPYQFGKSARKSVYAHALHLDAAKEFDAPCRPRLAAAYNYATGDKNARDSVNNSFVPLYQSSHDPYGLMDLFRWQNMREYALEFSVKPAQGLRLGAGFSWFWLDSVNDSWYDSSGRKLRTKAANSGAGHFAGRELDLLAGYGPGGGFSAEAGYAHFFSGRFAEDTGAGGDADWFYLQLTLRL